MVGRGEQKPSVTSCFRSRWNTTLRRLASWNSLYLLAAAGLLPSKAVIPTPGESVLPQSELDISK
jgi:hypothetical protein